jgi:hypothetical protein
MSVVSTPEPGVAVAPALGDCVFSAIVVCRYLTPFCVELQLPRAKESRKINRIQGVLIYNLLSKE